ncbi:MAG: hypothetical protein J1E80_09350 [Desulfovibrionaceae bacterium]|nr:hypothetical protein [Desulfovibrionaceae bacterium]
MLIPQKKSESETIIIVGPYRIPVTREAFRQWEAALMSRAGFTDKEIKAEILRRLGYASAVRAKRGTDEDSNE